MTMRPQDWEELLPIACQAVVIMPFMLITIGFERKRAVRCMPFEYLMPFTPWIASMLYFAFVCDERYFPWGMEIAMITGAGSLFSMLIPDKRGRFINKVLLTIALIAIALSFAISTGPAFRY